MGLIKNVSKSIVGNFFELQTWGLNGGVTLFLSRSDQLIELKKGWVFTAL